jgi:ribokinase
LTGQRIVSLGDAEKAAGILLERGVETVILTLGARGALVRSKDRTQHVPAVDAGRVLDTTGAGDAFNGGFAVGISEHQSILDAVRFGCTVAGLSVTRHGTAPSMPTRKEADALFADAFQSAQVRSEG